MNAEKLMPLLKYYHGESEPPEDYNPVQHLWWEGEKLLYQNVSRDPAYFTRVLESFDKCLKNGGASGALSDNKISKEKRAIIFFLDIWHGQYHPYDSLDLINEY